MLLSVSNARLSVFFRSRVVTLENQAHSRLNLPLHQLAVQLRFNQGPLFFQILQQSPVVQTGVSRGGRGVAFSVAGGAEDDGGGGGGGGGGAVLAFVFPVFVTMLPLSLLVLVRGVFVLFVLTAVLVFFPLVFTAAAVVFGPFFRFLAIIDCQPLWKQKKQQISPICR